MSKNVRKKWHRLFGLFLTDLFEGTSYKVELEKELSQAEQFLDVAVVRREGGEIVGRLPDGFAPLAAHNLISFKSYRGYFDAWAVNELIGHYVNYRKQAERPTEKMLPESDFRLYGICARYPKKLLEQVVHREVSPGVYDLILGTITVRLLVIRLMPESDANALLLLFSGIGERVGAAGRRLPIKSPKTERLLIELVGEYESEGLDMPYTMEDFDREFIEKALKVMTPEVRVNGTKPEERLSLEDRFLGLSDEERGRVREILDGQSAIAPSGRKRANRKTESKRGA